MDIAELYEKVCKLSLTDKKKTLAQLTPDQKKEFDKYNNKQRQKKYIQSIAIHNPDKLEHLKLIKKENKIKLLQNPETKNIYKLKNISDVKKFRDNQKKLIDDIIKKNAIHIIINAIKYKIAKQKLNLFKIQKEKKLRHF